METRSMKAGKRQQPHSTNPRPKKKLKVSASDEMLKVELKETKAKLEESKAELDAIKDRIRCPICFEVPNPNNLVVFEECGHTNCNKCVRILLQSTVGISATGNLPDRVQVSVVKEAKCSICRTPIGTTYFIEDEENFVYPERMSKPQDLAIRLAGGIPAEIKLDCNCLDPGNHFTHFLFCPESNVKCFFEDCKGTFKGNSNPKIFGRNYREHLEGQCQHKVKSPVDASKDIEISQVRMYLHAMRFKKDMVGIFEWRDSTDNVLLDEEENPASDIIKCALKQMSEDEIKKYLPHRLLGHYSDATLTGGLPGVRSIVVHTTIEESDDEADGDGEEEVEQEFDPDFPAVE